MNIYGDFRNPRTEIRRKKLFRKKRQFKDFLGSQNAQKSVSFQKHYFVKKHVILYKIDHFGIYLVII